MTTPGDGTPGPGGEEPAPAAGSSRRRRRAAAVLGAVAVVVVSLGLVAVWIGPGDADPGPLDADAPGLNQWSVDPGGTCAFDAERGGMVAHFAVTTLDAGRFTIDVAAVTKEGEDDADITSPHVVRYTVPFYGGRTTKEFDVVVPLTEAEHRDGYRRCRYTIGQAD